jgi:hypothetical protein
MLLDDLDFGMGGAGEVPLVQRRPDEEVVRNNVLQRGLSNGIGQNPIEQRGFIKQAWELT